MANCCPEKVLCSIKRQLSCSSPCENEMAEMLPIFWNLVCYEAIGNCQLQALLTKQQAILFLMGCESYSTDVSETHYRMDASTVADSRADFRSQSQATGSSSRFSKGEGNTRYDENYQSQSDGTSERFAESTEKGDGESFYRDDGKGNGFNFSQSFNFIQNRQNHFSDRVTDDLSTEVGSRRDCNYEYSTNNTEGDGLNLIVGVSFTGSGSEWRKYSSTNANSAENTLNNTTTTATENDTGLSTGRGRHDWESNFIADIEWYDNDYEVRVSRDRSDRRSDSSASARGEGDGIHEERMESKNSSQGTAQSLGDSESTRVASRVSNTNAFTLANSQRFANLRRLYDQLEEQIAHVKKRLKQTSPSLITQLPCHCLGDCCCGPIHQKILIGASLLSNPRIM